MWALALHGGASSIPEDKHPAYRNGLQKALDGGRAVLEAGGSALDCVEATVRILEADPTFNAGLGSVINAEGEIEMSASIMEGGGLHVGAAGALSGFLHPVSISRIMLEEDVVLMVGEGARRFAIKHEAERCASEELFSAAGAESHDTVGCVALDRQGRFAVASSTGGLKSSISGRIGDSPEPGCGFYADDQCGGVVFSGDGESIARAILAARVILSLESLGAQKAVEQSLENMPRVGGEAGGIAIDRQGRVGWHHNSEHFAVAMASSENSQGNVYLSRSEADAS